MPDSTATHEGGGNVYYYESNGDPRHPGDVICEIIDRFEPVRALVLLALETEQDDLGISRRVGAGILQYLADLDGAVEPAEAYVRRVATDEGDRAAIDELIRRSGGTVEPD